MTILSTTTTSSESMQVSANAVLAGELPVSIREAVLETIRCRMPVTTLCTPKLQLNLGVFIEDQIRIRSIATCLFPLFSSGKKIEQEDVERSLKDCQAVDQVRQMFRNDQDAYVHLLCRTCFEGMTQVPTDRMTTALQARIFTVKNALIAQKSPETIVQSQRKSNVAVQAREQIVEEGASFLKESLRFHLDALVSKDQVALLQQLTTTAEQLMPPVQEITKVFLQEHQAACPENPLTFRDPTGYNRQGLVAATVMGCFLHVLGFKVRMLSRSDLEPTVNLASSHSIVEVTFPNKKRCVVDPTYIQFHKDLSWDDDRLPQKAVLVLQEDEVDAYIDTALMTEWKKNFASRHSVQDSHVQILKALDRISPYTVGGDPRLKFRNFTDPESWVRKSLKKLWDCTTYNPIHRNAGLQAIFYGVEERHRTYDLVAPLGIAPLMPYLSNIDIKKRLGVLLEKKELHRKNDPDAVALIAQLPTVERDSVAPLLDLDPRLVLRLSSFLNTYFRTLKKLVNPEGEEQRVLYACSGADCTTVLLATDASQITFVDLTSSTAKDFSDALRKVRQSPELMGLRLETSSDNFITRKCIVGGSSSHCDGTNRHYTKDLELKFFLELYQLGVDLAQVKVQATQDGAISVNFPWQYHGASTARLRSITFIQADITKPDEYPSSLQKELNLGFDIFYMKAAFYVPYLYKDFLPCIAQSIRRNGWLMTADVTIGMDFVNPEKYLNGNGQAFISKKSREVEMFEDFMQMAFDPLCTIPQLEAKFPRAQRVPGTELSYWAVVHPRQKIMPTI